MWQHFFFEKHDGNLLNCAARKPIYGWMVRWTVVSLAHQGSNPGARICSWIYFRIFGDAH